jgi:hypothetical protein
MKHLSILIIIFFASFNLINGQRVLYYDMLELSKSLDKEKKFNCSETNKFSCLPILKKYYFPLDSDMQFSKYFKQNPFLKEFIPNVSNVISRKFLTIEPKDFSLNEIKKTDLFEYRKEQPQIMAKRFKEELSVAFFLAMKKDFENYTELKALFPETGQTIKYIDADNIYNMFPILRIAAIQDMDSYLIHLSRLRLQSRYYESLKTERGKIFSFTCMLASGMQQGQNIANLLSDIAEGNDIKKDSSNLFQAYKYFNLVSSCFRDTAEKSSWISTAQFKSLIENESKFKIMLGLMYQENLHLSIRFQRNGKIAFEVKNELEELASGYKLKHTGWIEYFSQVYYTARKAESDFETLKNRLNNEDGNLSIDYKNYANSVKDFINSMLRIDNADESIILPDDLKTGIAFIEETNKSFCDFNTGRYGKAVFKTLQIMDSTLFYDNKNKESREKLARYSIFFANIAEAQQSEDVQMAIEAEISPVRTSSLKECSKLSISLNAYIGIGGGMEYPDMNKKDIPYSGLSLPIGIGIYKSTPGCKPIMGAAGLFCSVFDAGIPTCFRLIPDSSYHLPEMKLQNILAPGAWLIAGRLFNTPFSLGAGVQFAPQSRMVKVNGTPSSSTSWRWNVSVYYDLPLVYFYKK